MYVQLYTTLVFILVLPLGAYRSSSSSCKCCATAQSTRNSLPCSLRSAPARSTTSTCTEEGKMRTYYAYIISTCLIKCSEMLFVDRVDASHCNQTSPKSLFMPHFVRLYVGIICLETPSLYKAATLCPASWREDHNRRLHLI